jgi:hypothetical protein
MAKQKVEAAPLPQVSFRTDADEINRWHAAAKADGRSLTQWFRLAANTMAARQEKARAKSEGT